MGGLGKKPQVHLASVIQQSNQHRYLQPAVMGRGSLSRSASLLRQVSILRSGNTVTSVEASCSTIPIFDVCRSVGVGSSLLQLAGRQYAAGTLEMASQSTTCLRDFGLDHVASRINTGYYAVSNALGSRSISSAALQPSDVYVGWFCHVCAGLWVETSLLMAFSSVFAHDCMLCLHRFAPRHNSATPVEVAEMLDVVGFPTMEALIDATVPKAIRRADTLDLGKYSRGYTESEFLTKFKYGRVISRGVVVDICG